MERSPYLWTVATFEIVRGKDDDHINIQTHGLNVMDAKSVADFLHRWIAEKSGNSKEEGKHENHNRSK